MTKQEELFWLHTLQTNIQVVNDLERKLEDNEGEKEKAIHQYTQKHKPSYPEKLLSQDKNPKQNPVRKFFPCVPIVFSVLAVIGAVLSRGEGQSAMASNVVWLIAAVVSTLFLYCPWQVNVYVFPILIILPFFSMHLGAPLVIGILGIVAVVGCTALRIVELEARGKVEKENQSAKFYAEHQFQQEQENYEKALARLEKEAKKKYDDPSSSFMVKEKELRQQLEQCRALLNANTILHQDYKDEESIARIIKLMETGVADSIKEALQIMLQENQRHSQWQVQRLMHQWEQEDRRKAEAEHAREQFYQNMELQRLEHERIDQAKRAADELEEIRKKLEGK